MHYLSSLALPSLWNGSACWGAGCAQALFVAVPAGRMLLVWDVVAEIQGTVSALMHRRRRRVYPPFPMAAHV